MSPTPDVRLGDPVYSEMESSHGISFVVPEAPPNIWRLEVGAPSIRLDADLVYIRRRVTIDLSRDSPDGFPWLPAMVARRAFAPQIQS